MLFVNVLGCISRLIVFSTDKTVAPAFCDFAVGSLVDWTLDIFVPCHFAIVRY